GGDQISFSKFWSFYHSFAIGPLLPLKCCIAKTCFHAALPRLIALKYRGKFDGTRVIAVAKSSIPPLARRCLMWMPRQLTRVSDWPRANSRLHVRVLRSNTKHPVAMLAGS